jgi:hypothetical protein
MSGVVKLKRALVCAAAGLHSGFSCVLLSLTHGTVWAQVFDFVSFSFVLRVGSVDTHKITRAASATICFKINYVSSPESLQAVLRGQRVTEFHNSYMPWYFLIHGLVLK